MDDYIDDLDTINVVERLIKWEQVIRDRQSPFLNYSEDEFIDRYRLNKECVLTILAEIRDSLEPKQKKLSSISPLNCITILRNWEIFESIRRFVRCS
jgi:hypothetical protein